MIGKPAAAWMLLKKILGYRFVLRNAIFPEDPINSGMQLAFTLNMENVGYASPYNARPVQLIMRNKSTNEKFVFDIDADIRKWYRGSSTISKNDYYCAVMPKGDYDYFCLCRMRCTLSTRPEYAIRFANENIGEATTGYNKLGFTVRVE